MLINEMKVEEHANSRDKQLAIPPISAHLRALIGAAMWDHAALELKCRYYIFPGLEIDMKDALMSGDAFFLDQFPGFVVFLPIFV